jgi:hypothetical protein
VHPQVIAHERDTKIKRLAGKVDRVLVDAPCTGTGTLRRNPDLKWRHQPVDVAELSAKQTAILASAASLVKVRRTRRLRDLQRAARRERERRRALPRRASRTSRWATRRPSSRAPASSFRPARRSSCRRPSTAATRSTPRSSSASDNPSG